jgi:hypothetical protein
MQQPPAKGAGTGEIETLGRAGQHDQAVSTPRQPRPQYTGFLRRSDDGQGIVGVLYDFCDWPIEFIGTPGTADGVRGYVLEGVLGEPPSMRIPIIDDTPTGEDLVDG